MSVVQLTPLNIQLDTIRLASAARWWSPLSKQTRRDANAADCEIDKLQYTIRDRQAFNYNVLMKHNGTSVPARGVFKSGTGNLFKWRCQNRKLALLKVGYYHRDSRQRRICSGFRAEDGRNHDSRMQSMSSVVPHYKWVTSTVCLTWIWSNVITEAKAVRLKCISSISSKCIQQRKWRQRDADWKRFERSINNVRLKSWAFSLV